MEPVSADLEGVARACAVLGVTASDCNTSAELGQSVLAAGRVRLGYAGLASLTAARITRLPDHVLPQLTTLVAQLAVYERN